MKRSVLNQALAAVALCASAVLPAHSAYIDFEDVLPDLGFASINSGGFDFASSGAGFSGVDTAAGFVFAMAPSGSTGQFLFGLNTDALTMSQGGASFGLSSFDFGFVAPFPQAPGTSAGQLRVAGIDAGGGTVSELLDFGSADVSGLWSFASFSGGAFAGGVTSVTFSACIYDGTGGCDFSDGLAQFAIDNLSTAAPIPEPASAALALAALGLLAATRRRSI